MAEARAPIGFSELGIGNVLKQYRLKVPANQREYSWTDREVLTLFQDLAKAIEDEGASEYFLGTIVTIPQSEDLLEVVDGQQRLATTAILLAQIRNYLRGASEGLIADSLSSFLEDIDRDKRERIPKLTLNLDDNEFFTAMINSTMGGEWPDPVRSSHRLIAGAFSQAQGQIKKIVASFDKKDHGDVLNRWIRFLEHGAQIILLRVSTDTNAYRMFETLNDRGLKTSQADLVKNYIFGKSGDREPEAQQAWARTKSTLEALDDDDITVTFLRQAMIAMRGHLREKDVYDAVQKRAKGPQTCIQFLTSLESLAAIYVAIFNPEHEQWNSYPDSMRRAIQTLNLLNIRTLRPLMLACAAKLTPREAAESFRMFISWGVRLIVASSTSRGAVEEKLAGAARLVFSEELSDAAALQKKLGTIIPVDEQFRKAFEGATVSKAALARYYLRSLEMAAKSEQSPWFVPNDDKQIINLEHVMPSVPGAGWENADEDTVRFYSKRIGNLALLLAKSNSDLKNSEFSKKKAVYADSPYVLTRQIADVDDWGADEISARQKGLAKLALQAWPT